MANRNVIGEVGLFFERLKEDFGKEVDNERLLLLHERITFSQDGVPEAEARFSKDFLRRAEIFSFESLGVLGVLVGVAYCDEFFYYLVGVGDPVLSEGYDGVSVRPVSAGEAVLVFNYLSSMKLLRGDVMDLYDEVLYKDDEVSLKEVSLDVVLSFLPDIFCFHVGGDSVFFGVDENLSSKLGAALLSSSSRKHLEFPDDALSEVNGFSLGSSHSFPYDLLVGAMVSSNWQHAFIEVYKAFEYLYPVPALGFFRENLEEIGVSAKSSGSLELLGAIKKSFDWRPNEEKSLRQVLSALDGTDLSLGCCALKKIAGESNHEKIYKLRNSLIHYKAGEEMPWRGIGLTDSDWRQLVGWMIKSAIFCYSSFFQAE